MTWWTHIARRRVSLGFVLRIGGLPTLYASFPLPAAPWLTYQGEVYAWHECLTLDDIGDVATEIDPWTGRPVSSEVQVGFRLTPQILELLDFELAASAKATLMADASSADLTLTVDDETPLTGAATLYLGEETFLGDSEGAGEIYLAGRGAYGSRARPHYASQANIQEFGAGGGYISTRPMLLEGRMVSLWAVPMLIRDGIRSPYGSSLVDTANQLIATGPLFGLEPSYGNGTATLAFQNLAHLCEGQCYSRYPRASAGHGLPGYIQVDDDCCEISFAAKNLVDEITNVYTRRLQRDDGFGSPEDVPFGLWSIGNVGRWIGYTIELATAVIGETRSVYAAANNLLEDGRVQLTIETQEEFTAEWAPALVLLPSVRSLWPELGFGDGQVTADTATPRGSGLDSTMRLVFEASDPMPQFRLTERGRRRIYYRDRGEESFSTALSINDAAGNAVNCHVLVGEEILEIDGSGTVQPDGLALLEPVPYLSIIRRGACNTSPAELVVDGDDDPEELRQVLAFPGCSWGAALLYLMVSGLEFGATYSRFWRGSGPGIDVGLIDTASFLALGREPRDIVITEACSIGDILAILMPQVQCAVLADTSIRLIDLDPLTEDEDATAIAITHEDCDESWPTWDAGRDRIVNVVVGKNLGYDPGTGEGAELPYTQGTSAGTWGHQQALDVDCRWAGSAEQSEGVLAQAFDRTVAKFGSRFGTTQIGLRNAVKAWSIAPGGAVLITHPALPDGSGGLGMVARLARVWRCSRSYQGTGSRGQITAAVHDLDLSTARCKWAPGAQADTVVGDTATCTSAAEASHFEPGMVCRLQRRVGGGIAPATRTVLSVSGADIVFDAAIGLSAPIMIEFTGWAGATERQRKFGYLGRKRWS